MGDVRHVIPISGKDSATTAILQRSRAPELAYEYFYNDTFAELPEVGAWLAKMEAYLGAHIVRIGKNLEAIIYEEGILPSPTTRFCTRKAKIYPMEDYLAQDQRPVYLYLGIRADEARIGYKATAKINITPRYPLQDLGIDIESVYQILGRLDLLPPTFFWQRLYDAVIAKIGIAPVEQLSVIQRTRLFAWRSRPNCFYCFYQRIYEWVGLLEHHPICFAIAERIEADNGADGYTWRQGWSLKRVREEAERIFEKRVAAVCKEILGGVKTALFKVSGDEYAYFTDGELSLQDTVSCGLYCGK